jgi:hypothetical protein
MRVIIFTGLNKKQKRKKKYKAFVSCVFTSYFFMPLFSSFRVFRDFRGPILRGSIPVFFLFPSVV